jgi:uncharacterized protein (TIGR00730 family)
VHIKSICVYCGSSSGGRAVFGRAAETLGRELAERNIELVYGGGRRGLMGTLASAALMAGGRVVGVIPQALVDLEVAHRGLSELHIVHSMHERKAEMARRADAFLILPGAWGTLDELCEAMTWAQLGLHHKACGLWNVDNYYDLLLQFLEHAVSEKFLKAQDRDLLLVREDLTDLLARMAQFRATETRAPGLKAADEVRPYGAILDSAGWFP